MKSKAINFLLSTVLVYWPIYNFAETLQDKKISDFENAITNYKNDDFTNYQKERAIYYKNLNNICGGNELNPIFGENDTIFDNEIKNAFRSNQKSNSNLSSNDAVQIIYCLFDDKRADPQFCKNTVPEQSKKYKNILADEKTTKLDNDLKSSKCLFELTRIYSLLKNSDDNNIEIEKKKIRNHLAQFNKSNRTRPQLNKNHPTL